MSDRINLNDNVEASCGFTIGGYDFNLKYPTLAELEPITTISDERAKAIKDGDSAKLAELDAKLDETFYSFITPVNEGTPDIKEVLKNQPFPVVKAFNKFITTQFSVE